MKLAVIPARGGSKRIPRKNIRSFCGRPIISYSIRAAIQSGVFQRVIVSTDDSEIADVAQQYGAEIPFIRPPELADDFVGTTPVVRHALETLREQGAVVDSACCIYATAPFVRAEDLVQGYEILQSSGADYAFTVTSFAYPIQRAIVIAPSGRVSMLQPENRVKRSQDLQEAYHDAGQFYWGKTAAFRRALPILSEHSAPIILPRHLVQDIDTLEDWERAELMYKSWVA